MKIHHSLEPHLKNNKSVSDKNMNPNLMKSNVNGTRLRKVKLK